MARRGPPVWVARRLRAVCATRDVVERSIDEIVGSDILGRPEDTLADVDGVAGVDRSGRSPVGGRADTPDEFRNEARKPPALPERRLGPARHTRHQARSGWPGSVGGGRGVPIRSRRRPLPRRTRLRTTCSWPAFTRARRAGRGLVSRYCHPATYLHTSRGPDVAEELHQVNLAERARSPRSFRPRGSRRGGAGGGFKAWLFRIATNKTNDLWRSRGRERNAKEGLRRHPAGDLPHAGVRPRRPSSGTGCSRPWSSSRWSSARRWSCGFTAT